MLTLLAFASVTALTSRSLDPRLPRSARADVRVRRHRPADRPVAVTFGVDQLGNGIDIVIVAVGCSRSARRCTWRASGAAPRRTSSASRSRRGDRSRADARRSWKPWLRGAGIGFPFGALPAGGAEVPTFLSYATEKRLSRNQEEFGQGAIEGVAGPEAANNASFSGTLVPLLTLGLPTSATAAIMLAAFQIFNLQPGPELFQDPSPWARASRLPPMYRRLDGTPRFEGHGLGRRKPRLLPLSRCEASTGAVRFVL